MEPFSPEADHTTFTAEVVTRPDGLMADTNKLTAAQAEAARGQRTPKWRLVDGHLQRAFSFTEVSQAQSFTHRVQGLSHQRNQHPHIFVDFKAVRIELWTQAKNGLTEHDFQLAELIDQAVDMP